MPEQPSAIIVGSKGFVEAVQGHLRMRMGSAPEVARDPAELVARCDARGDVVVIEYAGEPWLEALRQLRVRHAAGSLAIVAAVPESQADGLQPLQRVGVDEVVRWQGRVDPVLWAVDRVMARPRPANPPPTTAQGRSVASPSPVVPAPARPPKSPSGRGQADSTPGALTPPAPTEPRPRTASWPGSLPDAGEARQLLSSFSLSFGGEGAERSVAEKVLAALDPAERDAVFAPSAPAGTAALFAATAAQRLRLALAVGRLPASPADAPLAVDVAAGQRLLSEADELIARLKELSAGPAPELAASSEAVRRALVDLGLALSGGLSQLLPAGEAAPQAPAAPAEAKPPAARVLTVEQEEPRSKPERRQRALWVAFAVIALAAAGYHGWHQLNRRAPPPGLPGLPANTYGVERGGGKMVSALPGKQVDPAELQRFKAFEQARGNVVREVGPGSWLVEPAAPAAAAQAPGGNP